MPGSHEKDSSRRNLWKYVSVANLLFLSYEYGAPALWQALSIEDTVSSMEDVRREPVLGQAFGRESNLKPAFAPQLLEAEVVDEESWASNAASHAFGDGVRSFIEDSYFKATFFPRDEQNPRRLGASVPANSSLGNSSSTDPHSSSHDDHGHASHPHDALFFLFNAIIFGTIVLHLTTLPKLHAMQQTVCLFVLGMLYSLVQEGLNLKKHIGVFGFSYDMWMDIDPHLLLFSMLPALLAGDAMTIDTAVARTVAKQCIFLAGPGVLFGSFMTAFFLWAYIPDWDFLLCLVTGSILAATDPVAVVGLLKELGASPTLTVQIQGESLLNDGTAIVLYNVAYDMLKGKKYDASDIMIILVMVAICAACLGIVIGWFFFQWIKLASDRLDHHAGMLQTALTICCAYWSFCISEGWLHISGVLCTVFASLLLADRMWPAIVDKGSLLHIWHMIEYLGNTVIFFLAGALFGNTMVHIDLIDYLHLLVIYVVCTFIRGVMLLSCRPILKFLSEDREEVSLADALVMTWGGLRGAVGLALAIAVYIDQAEGKISQKQARRVLFFVGGIASLTLCVNATTCPSLVKALGVTKTPKARQRMLYKIYGQLHNLMMEEDPMDAVKSAVSEVLEGAKHHIDLLVPSEATHQRLRNTLRSGPSSLWPSGSQRSTKTSGKVSVPPSGVSKSFTLTNMTPTIQKDTSQSAMVICDEYRKAKQKLSEVTDDMNDISALLDIPALPFAETEEKLLEVITNTDVHFSSIKSVNEAFLSLVRSQYWKQLEDGEFVGGIRDAEMLLTSTALAMKHAGTHLCDLKYLLLRLHMSHEDQGVGAETISQLLLNEEEAELKRGSGLLSRRLSDRSRSRQRLDERGSMMRQMTPTKSAINLDVSLKKVKESLDEKQRNSLPQTRLLRFLDSVNFNVFMSGVLIGNTIFIAIEQMVRKGDNYKQIVWLVVEMIFFIVFLIEFTLKFTGFKLKYFYDAWNLFDFTILCLSLFGIIVEIMAIDTGAGVHKEARIFRLNRVFRVFRIFRTLRLFKFFFILKAKLLHKDFSLRLAEHLRTITACRAFINAHVNAQQQLLVYCGDDGEIKSSAEARCIMESQTEIYKVIMLAIQESTGIEDDTLLGMRLLRDNVKITGKLTHFIHTAHEAGVINAREAETIIHPLQDHVRIFNLQMQRTIQTGLAIDPADLGYGNSHSLSLTEFQKLSTPCSISSNGMKLLAATSNGHADSDAQAKHHSVVRFTIPTMSVEDHRSSTTSMNSNRVSNGRSGVDTVITPAHRTTPESNNPSEADEAHDETDQLRHVPGGGLLYTNDDSDPSVEEIFNRLPGQTIN